ncbi:MAG: LptF/LptG family permease [Candidatus Wallbacteria bacterium]|nr:LptF/LptG family permease [Candidatus Wallbacteria bacterium]
MSLIDRYVFRQLGPPFMMGMVGSLTILSFGQFMRALKYLTEGKADKATVLKWFVFRVPEDMQYIFPAAALMATLFVFGRLSKESELAAMMASGISLGRLMAPVAAFGVAVSAAVFLFNDWVVPPAMRISQRIWEQKLSAAGPPNSTYKENILVKSGPNQLLYVGRFFMRDDSFRDLVVRNYGPKSLESMISSTSGHCLGEGLWQLEGAVETRFLADGEVTWQRKSSANYRLGETPESLKEKQSDANELTLAQLFRKIQKLEKRGLANTRPLRVEMYLKTAFPFCVLIFAFIGAAMGISPSRSGGFIGFGVSLILTFLYYMMMSLSASLGKTGALSPLLGAWLQNLLFLGVCIVLFLRAQSR